MEMEALVTSALLQQQAAFPYPFAITWNTALPTLDPTPLWLAILRDLQANLPVPLLATRFHLGLAGAITALVQDLHSHHAFTQVVLTGGVFQNQILHHQVQQRLTDQGLTVLSHQQIPPNDGGLSLGQAAIAAARLYQPTKACPKDQLLTREV